MEEIVDVIVLRGSRTSTIRYQLGGDPIETSPSMIDLCPPSILISWTPASTIEEFPLDSHNLNYPPIFSTTVTRGPVLSYADGALASGALG